MDLPFDLKILQLLEHYSANFDDWTFHPSRVGIESLRSAEFWICHESFDAEPSSQGQRLIPLMHT